ncbi:sporulation protein [Thermococcus chitonophagus]|uniref:Sporulation protein n=1 Tax=Thermococcus chitonophagus TaxID=54262 RepID=A0A2Z2N6W8_9EURY|nr:stage II sporulation protein M [Thermococcus chitonophagus]ASJ16373.1 sporulation protein [Thermococcus chitonophagus]
MRRKLKLFGLLIGIFSLGIIIGVGVAKSNPSAAEYLFKFLRKVLGGGELPTGFKLFLLIFLNNTRVALIMAFGGLIFGVLPLMIMFFNGAVVGMVTYHVYSAGEPIRKVLLSIIPHGVLEIPALTIAGVGGINWFLELVTGEGDLQKRFRKGFKEMLKLLLVAVFLLFVAALVEAFITPKIAGIS